MRKEVQKRSGTNGSQSYNACNLKFSFTGPISYRIIVSTTISTYLIKMSKLVFNGKALSKVAK